VNKSGSTNSGFCAGSLREQIEVIVVTGGLADLD
jgi:hypothetical protein